VKHLDERSTFADWGSSHVEVFVGILTLPSICIRAASACVSYRRRRSIAKRKIGRALCDPLGLSSVTTEKTKTGTQNYQARMRRALDHIDRHLDCDLDLDTVSAIAAF
jgi:hypothetical protein